MQINKITKCTLFDGTEQRSLTVDKKQDQFFFGS